MRNAAETAQAAAHVRPMGAPPTHLPELLRQCRLGIWKGWALRECASRLRAFCSQSRLPAGIVRDRRATRILRLSSPAGYSMRTVRSQMPKCALFQSRLPRVLAPVRRRTQAESQLCAVARRGGSRTSRGPAPAHGRGLRSPGVSALRTDVSEFSARPAPTPSRSSVGIRWSGCHFPMHPKTLPSS